MSRHCMAMSLCDLFRPNTGLSVTVSRHCMAMSLCDLFRPNTGVSNFDEEKSDLMQKYRKISADEAGKLTGFLF